MAGGSGADPALLGILQALSVQQQQTQVLLQHLVTRSSTSTSVSGPGNLPGGNFGNAQQPIFGAPAGVGQPPGLSFVVPGPPPNPPRDDGLKALDGRIMPAIPKADHTEWRNRVQEVLGFRGFCENLTAWVSLLDPRYQAEIRQVLTMTTPLDDSQLSSEQLQRSHRLFYLIKPSVTSKNSRFDIMVRLYEAESQNQASGYELLRRLRQELCVKSRSEIITFRNAVLEFSFLKDVSLVDNLRRLEAEIVRFRQILQTYNGPSTQISDLDLQDADLYQLLIKNLTGECKLYVQLNAPETYEGAKKACFLFFEKTVLNAPNTQRTPGLSLNELANEGAKKTRDPSKTKCWRCNKTGH